MLKTQTTNDKLREFIHSLSDSAKIGAIPDERLIDTIPAQWTLLEQRITSQNLWPTLVPGLQPNDYQHLPPAALPFVSPENIRYLQREQISQLQHVAQIQAIPQERLPDTVQRQWRDLSSEQVRDISSTAFEDMQPFVRSLEAIEQIVEIPFALLSYTAPAQWGRLHQRVNWNPGAFWPGMIKGLVDEYIPQLPNEAIPYVPLAKVRQLDGRQIA